MSGARRHQYHREHHEGSSTTEGRRSTMVQGPHPAPAATPGAAGRQATETPRPQGGVTPADLARPSVASVAQGGEQMNGAQSIVRSLEAAGVDVVFGIPGGAILPTYDPLMDSTKIRHILVRHEQG